MYNRALREGEGATGASGLPPQGGVAAESSLQSVWSSATSLFNPDGMLEVLVRPESRAFGRRVDRATVRW